MYDNVKKNVKWYQLATKCSSFLPFVVVVIAVVVVAVVVVAGVVVVTVGDLKRNVVDIKIH